jgi:hypothetical protein
MKHPDGRPCELNWERRISKEGNGSTHSPLLMTAPQRKKRPAGRLDFSKRALYSPQVKAMQRLPVD